MPYWFGCSDFKNMLVDNPMNDLVPLLFLSAPLVPFLIIYVVGATFSILRWRRDPMPSRLAFFAFVLFSARLFGSMATHWLTLRKDDLGWDTRTLIINLGIIGSVDVLVAIVAWILLLIALFARWDASVPMVGNDCAEKAGGFSEMATQEWQSRSG